MDDAKRDNNKVKRTKNDIKHVMSTYLQKRNYPSVNPVNIGKVELIKNQLIESEVSRPNSILYSCYNSDPVAIDNNFSKFVAWVKDLTKHRNICHDIEYLVAPLFCHLYLDILRGGNSERAASFFKCHLPLVEKLKSDGVVQTLLNSFASESEDTKLEEFRSNKYMLDLYPESLAVLKQFVKDNCHVVFLQALQTWFEIQEVSDSGSDSSENERNVNKRATINYQKLANAICDLKREPAPIFTLNISNTKLLVNSGLMKRNCSLIAFSEDSVILLRTIHNFDTILDDGEYNEIKITAHRSKVYCMDISPKFNYLVSGSSDNTLCIFNIKDYTLSHMCKGHIGPVYCVKISTNGQYIASGSQDTTARIWCIETGKMLRVLVGHLGAITCLDIHPNCLYIATGSSDKNVRLWSMEDGCPIRLMHGAKGVIYALAFNPDGQVLASASDDKKIRLWDITQSKVMVELKCKDQPIIRLLWSKDGKLLCGGTLNGVVKVWDFCKMKENLGDTNSHEPIITQNLNNKLLALDYAFGTFGTLTVK